MSNEKIIDLSAALDYQQATMTILREMVSDREALLHEVLAEIEGDPNDGEQGRLSPGLVERIKIEIER